LAQVIRLLRRLSRRGDGVAGDTMWGLLLEAAALVSTIISVPVLTRELRPEGYGTYAAIFGVLAVVGGFSYSGVMLTMLHSTIREREDSVAAGRSCLTLTWALGILGGIVGFFVLRAVVDEISTGTLLAYLAAELLAAATLEFAASWVQATHGFAPAVRFRLLQPLCRIVVLVGLFVAGAISITNIAVGNLAVFSVVTLGALGWLRRAKGATFGFGRPRIEHLRGIGAYSCPIAASAIQNDADKAVLKANDFDRDTGLYAAGYRVVQLSLVPMRALVAATHNRFLHHDENAKGEHVQRARQMTLVALVYSVVAAVGVVILAPYLTFIVGDEYEDYVPMARLLVLFLPLRCLWAFAFNGIMGLGRLGVRATIVMISAGISLVLYIVLVPTMSWKGAAIGTFVGEGALAVMSWWALLHYQQVHDRSVDLAAGETVDVAVTGSASAAAAGVAPGGD
jgi:O-antigen/teichoic acid export membrane protein